MEMCSITDIDNRKKKFTLGKTYLVELCCCRSYVLFFDLDKNIILVASVPTASCDLALL